MEKRRTKRTKQLRLLISFNSKQLGATDGSTSSPVYPFFLLPLRSFLSPPVNLLRFLSFPSRTSSPHLLLDLSSRWQRHTHTHTPLSLGCPPPPLLPFLPHSFLEHPRPTGLSPKGKQRRSRRHAGFTHTHTVSAHVLSHSGVNMRTAANPRSPPPARLVASNGHVCVSQAFGDIYAAHSR